MKRYVNTDVNHSFVQTPVPDGENNVEAVHLSRCGTELFSEGSWETGEHHDKQVRGMSKRGVWLVLKKVLIRKTALLFHFCCSKTTISVW